MTTTEMPPSASEPEAHDASAFDTEPDDEPRGRIGTLIQRYRNGLGTARSSLFWACLSRQKNTLKWMFFWLIINSVALLQVANLTRAMVDNGIVNQTAPLWPFVTHIAFWAVWSLIFGFISNQMGDRLSYSIEFDLRVWLYTHVQSAELRTLDSVSTGQLVTRSITDLQLVEQLLRIFPTLIGFSPLLVALAVIVVILNPFIGVIAILALPINVFMLKKFSRRLRALSWAELNERAEVTHAIDEPIRGIRVVKAFGREAEETARVDVVTDRAYRYSMSRVRLLAKYDGLMKAVPLITQASLLAVGAWRLSLDALSLGTFLLAFQLGTGLASIASIFDELSSAWQYLRGAQDRLAEMLAMSSRPVTDGRMVPAPSSGLEIDSVAVTYSNRRLLGGLSFTVTPGELVVVHGSPGSGKSTLAGIAAGMIPSDEGAARLDGLELEELDPQELRRAVRVVSEEPLLLASSLRDNLLLGAWGDISDAQLAEAMHTAAAEEVVAEMDGGFDGLVGDRGLTVSGGQRQRISLARALVAKPRVLVLDDALSAVNPSLEIEIMSRVRAALPATAILYITRRSGLLAVADRTYELPEPATVEVDAPAAPVDPLLLTGNGARSAAMAEGTGISSGAEGVMDVEELGMAAEESATDATGTRVDTSGLALIDAGLAKMIDDLQVSSESVHIPDDELYSDQLKSFWSIARLFRGKLFIALALMLVASIFKITPDIVFGQVSNLVGDPEETNLSAALALSAGLVVVAFLYAFVSWQFRIEAMKFVQGVILVLRRRMFTRLTKLGINYYDRELPGDVATRLVADLDNILRFASGPGFLLVSGLAITLVGLTAILIIAPATWIIVLLMVGSMVLATLIQFPFAIQGYGWAREELQVVTRKFQEDFSARHEIRHLGAHAIQTQKYVEACWERRRSRWWATMVQNSYSSVMNSLSIMTGALLLWKTGTSVLALQLTVGAALAVQVLSNTATLPLRTFGSLYNQGLDAKVSWGRLRHPFTEPILPVESPTAVDAPPLGGSVIRFEDVAFTYPSTTRPVLRATTFTMEPHKVTALVGYTGAGKSSIAKLLMRTYDPDAGQVSIDGVDIREFGVDSYRSTLGIVPQDPFLFQGTISSNIRYGKPDATEAEVEEAIRSVGAFDLLSALPGGFDHKVEEDAHNLTAAQRQLVALARAWVARPAILVLDESTSLLDATVEDQIIRSVHALGCTTLMITHRENVAKLADNIVVLEAGQVVDEGPEEIVAREGGPYDRLWRVQEDEAAMERDRQLAAGSD